MADELNRFFVQIISNLANEIPEAQIVKDYSFDHIRPEFKFRLTTVNDVEEFLLKIPSNKLTGLDGIPIRFMKLIPDF